MKKVAEKIVRTSLDFIPDGNGETVFHNGKIKVPAIPEGVSRKGLIRDAVIIAWPSLVELVLTQLTSMADQVMVGRMAGEAGIIGLSAVGLATQPKFLLMTMFQALNVGATAVIARYRGQQNQEKARQIFRQMLILNLFIGALFMLVGLNFAEFLIRFMSGGGVGEQAVQEAVRYLKIQMYGFVPLALTFTITAALRGVGDSKTPMIYNTVANVVNVIMNYALIYGNFGCPELGVAGASWATVIGQTVAFVIAVVVAFSGKNYIHFEISKIPQMDLRAMGSVLNIGFPAMVEQLFMRMGIIIFSRAVAGLGDTLYATHQICMSVQAMSFMMGQAFSNAATTLIGQSLGKRREDMAVIYMKQVRRMGLIVSIVVGALIILFNRTIVGFYNTNEEVIAAGSGILVLIALSQPLQSSQFIVSGGLRGAGDTKYTAFVVMITTLGVRSVLAVLTVSVLDWGLWGAWIALMADQILRTLLVVARYNAGKWLQIWGTKKASAEK